MWIDATVAASFVTDPKEIDGRRQGRLRAGAGHRSRQARQLAVGLGAGHPGGHAEAGGGQEVHHLGDLQGLSEAGRPRRKAGRTCLRARAPRSTRTRNTRRRRRSPKMTLDIDQLRPTRTNPTVKPVPYVGVQFVAIPEFQGLGTAVGQQFSAALAGADDRRRGACRRPAADDARNDEGRLHQVGAPKTWRCGGRAPGRGSRSFLREGSLLPAPADLPGPSGTRPDAAPVFRPCRLPTANGRPAAN